MIKTVEVSGITAVNFNESGKEPYFDLSEKYIWIRNKSGSAVYVSADENCVPEADGTAEIPPGGCARYDTPPPDKIYLSGTGTVEIHTSAVSESPWRLAGGGGGSGGTDDYIPLSNKPKVNGNTLIGDKSFEDLGLKPLTADELSAMWNN